ncbi:MAG: single-stranded-DNA-specific exonuclease RecJ [Agathobacter sp.]|nr:single-stranded-DNA-specific exonuclease RecJ [Agathobacter sp.]
MAQWMVKSKKADFKQIGERLGIDQVTARLLVNRGLTDEESMRSFLSGGIQDLCDPHLFKDGDKLVDILAEKIAHNEKIRVIGDYDIDGVMSSFILFRGLSKCGAKVSVAIPNRITDGYGLNIHLIEEALKDGVDTILTCDNGIAAINEIAYAKRHGMTVLVTDHHEIPYDERDGKRHYLASEADAIVNPHQEECGYPYKNLCGAAVAWKMIVLLYGKIHVPEESALDFLENVAFATVGDIMPLTGENRILVKEGLARIRHTKSVGMRALIAQCGLVPEQIDCYHFGFVLGPCINAAGRLDTARRALELFMTDDEQAAAEIVGELVTLNSERKELTRLGVEEAKALVDEGECKNDPVLVLFLPEVHESIAGIIAGRIREHYYRPTFILTRAGSEETGDACDAPKMVKGSGRSIDGYSMYEELCLCKDLLHKFGGHPMAAGVTLQEESVGELRRRLNEQCTLTEEQLEEKIHIDVPMPTDYVTCDLVREFELLAPFGRENPKPLFADRNLSVSRMWLLGKNQNVLRLSLVSEHGTPAAGIYFGDIPVFMDYMRKQFGSEAVELALCGRENGIRLSVVYSPQINFYGGSESLQLEIKYYR